MLAGLEAATGDLLAVMDVDLQDPPALLGEMLQRHRGGGLRLRGDPPRDPQGRAKACGRSFARAFYRLINRISKTEVVDGARDFRLMTRQMADAILSHARGKPFQQGHIQLGGVQHQMAGV